MAEHESTAPAAEAPDWSDEYNEATMEFDQLRGIIQTSRSALIGDNVEATREHVADTLAVAGHIAERLGERMDVLYEALAERKRGAK